MSKNDIAVGAALEYTRKALGGDVVELTSVVSVGNSRVIAVDGNGDRVGLIFINMGSGQMFLLFDPAVSTTNGIVLAPAGGNVSMSVVFDYTLPSRRWYAIGDVVGPNNLTVIEYSRLLLAPKK